VSGTSKCRHALDRHMLQGKNATLGKSVLDRINTLSVEYEPYLDTGTFQFMRKLCSKGKVFGGGGVV
jgi:hypothetical protein